VYACVYTHDDDGGDDDDDVDLTRDVLCDIPVGMPLRTVRPACLSLRAMTGRTVRMPVIARNDKARFVLAHPLFARRGFMDDVHAWISAADVLCCSVLH